MKITNDGKCVNHATIGETPLPYFIVGILELCLLLLLYFMIRRTESLAARGVKLAADLLVLPVYQIFLIYVLLVGAVVCVINIFNIYPTNIYIICVKWFLYRTCAEGLAINLMHNGVGPKSMR